MTQFIEILCIAVFVVSVVMLILLIILRIGVTVTSRPLTEEEVKKLESRKWFRKRKSVDAVSSVPIISTKAPETTPKSGEVVRTCAEKEQTALKTLADNSSSDKNSDAQCNIYRRKFLKCKRVPNRSHIYIDRECITLIKNFLPLVAPDASISGFVSNIVADHLEKHKAEIIKMYNDRISKII